MSYEEERKKLREAAKNKANSSTATEQTSTYLQQREQLRQKAASTKSKRSDHLLSTKNWGVKRNTDDRNVYYNPQDLPEYERFSKKNNYVTGSISPVTQTAERQKAEQKAEQQAREDAIKMFFGGASPVSQQAMMHNLSMQAYDNASPGTQQAMQRNAMLSRRDELVRQKEDAIRKLQYEGDIDIKKYNRIYAEQENLDAYLKMSDRAEKEKVWNYYRLNPDYEGHKASDDAQKALQKKYVTSRSARFGRTEYVEGGVATINGFNDINEVMTEEQQKTYAYLYDTMGEEKANQYFEDIYAGLETRQSKDYVEMLGEMADAAPGLASAVSVATNLIGGVQGTVGEALYNIITSNEINGTGLGFANTLATQEIRERVSKDYTPAVRFFYQTGMSIADSLAAMPMGDVGTVLMSMSAASSTASEMAQKGASAQQIVLSSVIAGAIEYATEHSGLERVTGYLTNGIPSDIALSFKNNLVQTLGVIARETGSAALAEGGEEVLSSIGNMIADQLINGNNSDLQRLYQQFLAEGMSEQEASKAVWAEIAKEIGTSFAGGALSGGAMSGGAMSLNIGLNDVLYRAAESMYAPEAEYTPEAEIKTPDTAAAQQQITELAESLFPENEQTRRAFEAAYDGGNVSDYAAGFMDVYGAAKKGVAVEAAATTQNAVKLARETQQAAYFAGQNEVAAEQEAIKAEEARKAETANKPATAFASEGGTVKQAVQPNTREDIAARNMNPVETVVQSEYDISAEGNTAELAKPQIRSILDTSARKVFEKMKTDNVSADVYTNSFLSIYSAARNGNMLDEAIKNTLTANRLSNEQINAAYEAGKAARLNDMRTANEAETVPSALSNAKPGILREYDAKGLDFKRRSSVGRSIRALDVVAKKYGKTVHVVNSIDQIPDLNGKTSAKIYRTIGQEGNSNAFFNTQTGEYYIALDAVDKSYFYVAMHESIHDGAQNNRAGYENLAAITREVLVNNGFDAEELDSVSDIEEFMCNTVPVILTDRATLDEFVGRVVGADIDTRTAFEKFIGSIYEMLMEAYEALKNDPQWSQMESIRNDLDGIKRMRDAYFEMLEGTANTEAENGFVIDESSGAAVFSLKTAPKTDEEIDAAIDRLVKAGFEEESARAWIESLTSVGGVIMQNMQTLDYEPDARYTWLKKNSDYTQGSVDFNNNCPKRVEFTALFDRLQKEFPNVVFTAEDYETIRQILIKRKIPVTCGPCFVEDRRQHLGEIAQQFIDQLNDGELAPKFTAMLGKDTYIPTQYDLVTYGGAQTLYKEHRGVYNAFIAFNNARGMASARLVEGMAEYNNQIKKWSKRTITSKNNKGGLRIFSLSDADPRIMIDVIQIVIDSAEKGLMIQGYTKKPWFAKMIKDTGIKMLRSHIPLGVGFKTENGKKVLVFDNVEGINTRDADYFDSTNSKTIGNNVIGINNEQIRLAMISPMIDQIIPFHTGLKAEIRNKKKIGDWQNYRNSQTDKNAATGKKADKQINIYTDVLNAYAKAGKPIKNKVEFVQAFLDVCKERGLTPRFSEFLNVDENGEFVYTEGYHKFLVDYKLFDSKGNILLQQPVQPIFDDAFNKKILNDYVKNSGVKVNRDDVYEEIKAEVIEGGKFSNKSEKDFEPDLSFNSVAILRESTIERWLQDYASKGNKKYAQAYVAYISPREFLKMTTTDFISRIRLIDEARDMNANKLRDATIDQPIQLIIDTEKHMVVGHEGRHRMIALMSSDINKVPVLLFDSQNKYSKSDLANYTLRGQFNDSEITTIDFAIPLNYENEHRIIEEFTTQPKIQEISERIGRSQTFRFSLKTRPTNYRTDAVILQNAKGITEAEKNALAKYQLNSNSLAQRTSNLLMLQEKMNTAKRSERAALAAQIRKAENDVQEFEARMNKAREEQALQDILIRERVAEWGDFLSEFGMLPKGEQAKGTPENREIDVPAKTSEDAKVSRYARTILESKTIPDELIDPIRAKILEGGLSYIPESNANLMDTAMKRTDEDNISSAWRTWDKAVKGELKMTSSIAALGEALLKRAAENGDAKQTVILAAELTEMFSRAGKIVQSAKLLKRMGVAGQIAYLDRTVASINRSIAQRGEKIFEKHAVELNEDLLNELLKAKTEEERDGVMARIYQDIADRMPNTFLDKWNAWRYLAMLGNPLTHIRNMVGNAIFVPAIAAKNVAATLYEKIAKSFGATFTPTKAIIVGEEYDKFAKADFEKIKNELVGGSKYSDMDEIRKRQRIFGWKALEKVRNFNSDLLEKEDGIFLRMHYRTALGQYLSANKIDLTMMSEETLGKARAYAMMEAQKATYRAASKLATILQNAGNGSGTIKFIIDSVVPFKKTPINILKSGVNYSPVGLITTIAKGLESVYKQKKEGAGTMTMSEFIDGMASGTVGTAAVALGYFFASIGALVGGLGDDDEDRLRKLTGEQGYAVKIGNNTYTISWAAPISLPFLVGAALYDTVKEQQEWDSASVFHALSLISEPVVSLSMLDGVQSMLDAAAYASDEERISKLAEEAVSSYVSQPFPTVLAQIARIIDPNQRSVYVDKNKKAEFLQRIGQNIAKKIPGLTTLLMPSRNEWGEERKSGIGERIIENTVSPGYYSKVEYNAVETELMRLLNETGDGNIVPDYPQKKIGNKNLTRDEYESFAALIGQPSLKLLSEMIKTNEYKKMDDDAKVRAIRYAYSYVEELAKEAVAPGEGSGPAKWMLSIQNTAKTPAEIADLVLEHTQEEYIDKNRRDAAWDAFDNGNTAKMIEYINEMRKNGTEDSDIWSSVSRKYKAEYIALIKAGNRTAANALANRIKSLGLKNKDGEAYASEDKFAKWRKDAIAD